MKKNLLKNAIVGIVSLIVAGFSLKAAAQGSIQGSINFDGYAILNDPLGSATAITNISGIEGPTSDPVVIYGSTGDYSTVPSGTTAAFTPFAFDGSQTLPLLLWTFSVGTTNYSFELDSITSVFQTINFLNITGSGTAQITGFSDTAGTWSITSTSADPNSINVTFSSSIDVVPEPSVAALVGIGSLALLGINRFRRKS